MEQGFFNMKHFCYILFSPSVKKYYIGETEDIDSRILQHNTGFFKDSYTKIADDWKLFLSIECLNRIQARKIEAHIKKMKSKKYIENLKKYPEIISKLKFLYP